MSDTCYLSVTWHKKDTPKVLRAFGIENPTGLANIFGEGTNEEGNEITGSECEAKYAYHHQLEALAGMKVNFYGCHSEGGEYGPEIFVCWRGKMTYLPTLDMPMVSIGPDGKPNAKELARVKRYYVALKRVEEYIAKEKRQ